MRLKAALLLAALAAVVAIGLVASSGNGAPAAPTPTATAAGVAPDGWPMGAVPDVELAGIYTIGFESSALDPCPASVPGLSSPVWIHRSGTDAFERALAARPPPPQPETDGYEELYVRVGGDLTPYHDIYGAPNSGYGHLGAFARELRVRYVLEMSRDGTCAR